MKKDIVLHIKDELFKRLEGKNSWGKEEVKNLYLNIVLGVLIERQEGLSNLKEDAGTRTSSE